jgi:RNA polymerase sigma-70 factor (sigma-E family)
VDDRASFSAFVHEASRSLQRTAWLLTGDWATAEDLVQTALAKTWTRWGKVEHGAAHGYVRRVMMTTFLGWRARRWTGELLLGWVPDRPDGRDPFDHVDVRAPLVSALLALPRQQRAVIVLRYFDDLSEQETASALGCSVGTVKSHAARALKALRTVPGLDPAMDRRTLS